MDLAWEDLAEDDDWWKATLTLGLMNCVPVIGQVMIFGYLFDWAKEAAWGMSTPFSRKLADFGRCAKYGFLALWIVILWLLPIVIAGVLLGLIPVCGSVISFFVYIFAFLMVSIAAVAAFRSIIYERVAPGLQVKRIFHMVKHDFGGLVEVFSIFLLTIPVLVAALFVVLLPTIPFINVVSGAVAGASLGVDLVPMVLLGMLTIVVALVVWVGFAMVSAFICALYVRALGYWMRGFDPAAWRSPKEPMPFEIEMDAEKKAKKEAKAEAKADKKARRKAEKTAQGETETEAAAADTEETEETEETKAVVEEEEKAEDGH